jgi:hypothetical protein
MYNIGKQAGILTCETDKIFVDAFTLKIVHALERVDYFRRWHEFVQVVGFCIGASFVCTSGAAIKCDMMFAIGKLETAPRF